MLGPQTLMCFKVLVAIVALVRQEALLLRIFIQSKYSFFLNPEYPFKQNIHFFKIQNIHSNKIFIFLKRAVSLTPIFVSFLLELLASGTNIHVVSHSLPNIFWRLMASGNYFVLFSWPHIHTEVFGVDSIPLPCSEEVRYTPFATHLLLITFRMQIERWTRCALFSPRM